MNLDTDNQVNLTSYPFANFATSPGLQHMPTQFNQNIHPNNAGGPRSSPASPLNVPFSRTVSLGQAGEILQRQNSGDQGRVYSTRASSNQELLADNGNYIFDSFIPLQADIQPHRKFRSQVNSRLNSQNASPVHHFSGQNSPLGHHGFSQALQGNQWQQILSNAIPVAGPLQCRVSPSPQSPLMGTLQTQPVNYHQDRNSPPEQQNILPRGYGQTSAPTSPGLHNSGGINDSMAPFFNQYAMYNLESRVVGKDYHLAVSSLQLTKEMY